MFEKPRGETIDILLALGALSSHMPETADRARVNECIDAMLETVLDELEVRIKTLAEFNRAFAERQEAAKNQQILDNRERESQAEIQAEQDKLDEEQRQERSDQGVS